MGSLVVEAVAALIAKSRLSCFLLLDDLRPADFLCVDFGADDFCFYYCGLNMKKEEWYGFWAYQPSQTEQSERRKET